MEGQLPLQNGQFGSKIKNAKNMSKTILQEYSSCFVQKTILQEHWSCSVQKKRKKKH